MKPTVRELCELEVNRMQVKFHMTEWRFTIKFVDGKTWEPKVKCKVDVLWEYKEATFEFKKRVIKKKHVPEIVLHEFVHCVTIPMRHLALRHVTDPQTIEMIIAQDESQVTHLERILLDWNAPQTNL